MTITDKLAEAIELAEDAMAYVPEYFTNKHGMNRRMAALKEDFAAHASRQAEPSDARVEAAAMALARMSYGPQALDSDAAEWREHARAVLQASDAVSAGPGWMPIETAPKDGRIVLYWVNAVRYSEDEETGQLIETDVSQPDLGQWIDGGEHGAGYHDPFAGIPGDAGAPTHWQPLPNPPSAMRAARSAK